MSTKKRAKLPLSGPEDSDLELVLKEDFGRKSSSSARLLTTDSPFPFIAFSPTQGAAKASPATPVASTSQEKASATHANLVQDHAARVRDDPLEFAKQLSLWTTGTTWRAYNDYIGQRILYDGYSAQCIQNLLNSPVVVGKIHELSLARLDALNVPEGPKRERRLKSLEAQLREVAYAEAFKLAARLDSTRNLQLFAAFVNNVLVRMYHQGIHISLSEFKIFRNAAIKAAGRKQSLIIVPCHKSHVDYLTISWLCIRLGISLPHIIAGDNLNLPIIGPSLQNCGAIFIKRSFGDDALYPVLVKEYIDQLLEKGMNFQFFIEGSRSRTGKLLSPKFGILKYVMEAFLNGRAGEDVFICPVSLQYDKVIETESYVNELLGNPKEKESLWGLVTNTRVLQLKMGRIDVRFQKPWSLRDFVNDQIARRNAPAAPSKAEPRSTAFSKENPKDRRVLLKALGYQILNDINEVAVIMPAALVGSVVLTLRGRGVGRSELIRRVSWLIDAVTARGGRVADFAGMELDVVVDRALDVLKDLIGRHNDLIEPTFYPISRFELSFYRNQVIHLFVQEALLSAALYTRVKQGGAAPSQRMSKQVILEELSFVSRLLQNEFVYATEGLETNSQRTIDSLEKEEVILVEGELVGLSPKERASGRENYDFYCFMIWPFIETYWLAAVSLFALTPTPWDRFENGELPWFAEKSFEKSAQHLGKTLHYTGDVSYLEAVNQATLSNAFQRFVEMGMVQTRRSKDTTVPPLMTLNRDWTPRRTPSGDIIPEGKLWSFLERLGAFRREGKNRRDNSTVSTRVFTYCSAIAPTAIEWTPSEEFAQSSGSLQADLQRQEVPRL